MAKKYGDRGHGDHLMPENGAVNPILNYYSDIPAEPVKWLWEGRIPLGMLTLLVGYEGNGKSMLAMYLMAQVSTGRAWFDRPEEIREPGSALYLTTEDDQKSVVKPRLMAAGADVSKIADLSGFVYNGKTRPLSNLTDQVVVLLEAAKQMPDLKLIVIDPISAYMEGKNENKNSEVREYLNPLVELAQARSIAVIGITHLNKNSEAAAMSRVLGSRAFTATPRAAWLVHKDPNTPRVLVVRYKWNLGRSALGMAFKIDNSSVTYSNGVVGREGYCLFEKDPVLTSAETLLKPKDRGGDRGRPPKKEEAGDWLVGYLRDGPRDTDDIFRDGETEGYSQKTLERARTSVGILTAPRERDELGQMIGTARWFLPE